MSNSSSNRSSDRRDNRSEQRRDSEVAASAPEDGAVSEQWDETTNGPRYLSMTTPTDLEEIAREVRDEIVSRPDEGPAVRE